ncbi:hypothetical protein Fcan01_03886 [Folsomia candida]|uniref:Uncharacterized protein n=1 Tax=Folsomia candida TaxID=158441 RepID=A0A226F7H6_FOLCA|nr:hypothetical protein Fcan01_03886 [Folsomia candida]
MLSDASHRNLNFISFLGEKNNETERMMTYFVQGSCFAFTCHHHHQVSSQPPPVFLPSQRARGRKEETWRKYVDKSALFVAKERLRLLTWTSDTSASLRVIDDFLAEKWNCSLSMLHDQGVNDGKLLLASGRIIMKEIFYMKRTAGQPSHPPPPTDRFKHHSSSPQEEQLSNKMISMQPFTYLEGMVRKG